MLLILFIGCTSSNTKNSQIVEDWQGKQILFSDTMSDFLTGDEIDLTDADFSIITYIDSIGCTGCKMKLALWNSYLDSLYSSIDSNLKFVAIVNTRDSIGLKNLLHMYAFKYNVCYDLADNMNQLNKFPKDISFQTFLLDKNKRVVAIGNPVLNQEIGILYDSILSGQVSVSLDTDKIVSIYPNAVDLGILHKGQSVKKSLTISNIGDGDVNVSDVISSCECIDILLPSKIIPFASDLEVTVVFKGDTIDGDFERTLHIYYDGFDYPSIINVNGCIR